MTSSVCGYLPNCEPLEEKDSSFLNLEARFGWESARLERLDLLRLPLCMFGFLKVAKSLALPVILDLRRFETEMYS